MSLGDFILQGKISEYSTYLMCFS